MDSLWVCLFEVVVSCLVGKLVGSLFEKLFGWLKWADWSVGLVGL